MSTGSSPGELVPIAQASIDLGVSKSTLYRYERDLGMPGVHRVSAASGGRRPRAMVDVSVVREWLRRHQPRRGRPTALQVREREEAESRIAERESGASSEAPKTRQEELLELDLRLRRAKTRKEEAAAAKLRGELIPRADWEAACIERIAAVKRGLDRLVDRLPAVVQGLGEEAVRGVVREEVRAILSAYADGWPSMAGSED